MRFLKRAFTFAAFSALAASVLGAPVETSTIVDYDKGDLARHAVDVGGLDEHLAGLSLPTDARYDSRLVERRDKVPPTKTDIKVYLANLQKNPAYAGYTQKLVFWSGVTEDQAKSFATKNKRFTVGMLIQPKTDWDIYKKPKSEGGHWKDWAETFKMFWDPISEAMAELAQGDVYGYFTEERAVEQKDIKKCQAVWCRIEKSILVQSLKGKHVKSKGKQVKSKGKQVKSKGKQVKSIAKYVLYKNGSTKQDGFIRTISA